MLLSLFVGVVVVVVVVVFVVVVVVVAFVDRKSPRAHTRARVRASDERQAAYGNAPSRATEPETPRGPGASSPGPSSYLLADFFLRVLGRVGGGSVHGAHGARAVYGGTSQLAS